MSKDKPEKKEREERSSKGRPHPYCRLSSHNAERCTVPGEYPWGPVCPYTCRRMSVSSHSHTPRQAISIVIGDLRVVELGAIRHQQRLLVVFEQKVPRPVAAAAVAAQGDGDGFDGLPLARRHAIGAR